jgi:hypothetical protein
MKTMILGGGLAALSCSYHLGHENSLIIERNSYLGGHVETYSTILPMLVITLLAIGSHILPSRTCMLISSPWLASATTIFWPIRKVSASKNLRIIRINPGKQVHSGSSINATSNAGSSAHTTAATD